MAEKITLTKLVKNTPDRVYKAFLDPTDLTAWYHASGDWTTPWAKVDAVPGGKLAIRFEDPQGVHSFDYVGTFNELKQDEFIDYDLEDGRNVTILLAPEWDGTLITETFDAEAENSIELQRKGWAEILDNLSDYLDH